MSGFLVMNLIHNVNVHIPKNILAVPSIRIASAINRVTIKILIMNN